jgi:sugar phosphate isomerase/epimerase
MVSGWCVLESETVSGIFDPRGITMKVGIITDSLRMELRASLRKARELGAHGVQLWVVNTELDARSITPSGRDELITLMNSLGLERAALCGDIGGFADIESVEQRIAHTKIMFDLAVDLKTPVLTTHIGVVPDDTSSKEYAQLVEAVREVAFYAADRECCLGIETGPESGAALAAFIRTVGSPGIRVNFDPANLCMGAFDPIQGVRDLAPYIVHTHAKDGIYDSDRINGGQEVPLGRGDVDFPGYLQTLREVGYSGYLTVERECGDDPVADVAEAVRFLKTQEGVEA